MTNLADDFKINLNQNLWGLVVALISLGLSEHLALRVLFWFAVVLVSLMTLSVVATTIAYTLRYCRNKGK
jgi:hypothetical protein